MDRLTAEKRSWNMSRIRSKDTKPEKVVRSLLYKLGYRFRLHVKTLPGNPDIVLSKYNIIILVHGCFWHRHDGCKYAYQPKSRKHFWQKKFDQNVKRDKDVIKELKRLGWKVAIIWECETKKNDILEKRIKKIFT